MRFACDMDRVIREFLATVETFGAWKEIFYLSWNLPSIRKQNNAVLSLYCAGFEGLLAREAIETQQPIREVARDIPQDTIHSLLPIRRLFCIFRHTFQFLGSMILAL